MSANLFRRHPGFRRTISILVLLLAPAMALAGQTYISTAGESISAPHATAASAHTLSGADLMVRTISAGSRHTCALGENGGVWCWGWNASGQLGDGSRTLRTTPVAVQGLSRGVADISVGDDHACALTDGGAVYCWGSNAFGRLGDGTTVNRDVPVQVSGLSQGVTAIAVGSNFSCAAGVDGAVCWGRNQWGQLGDGSREVRWVPGAVEELSEEVRTLVAGVGHACALTVGGAVRCWGRGAQGQLGDGRLFDRMLPVTARGLTSGVRSITAGDGHTCAVDADGVPWCWGYSVAGEESDDPFITQPTPVPVDGLPEDVLDIATRGRQTCAVTGQGEVWCWGRNDHGQIGPYINHMIIDPIPRRIEGLPGSVRTVAMGTSHVCAVTAIGASYCWGGGNNGQLGNGTIPDRQFQPVIVHWANAGVPTVQVALRLGGISGDTHQRIVRRSEEPVTFGWSTHGLPANSICHIRRYPDNIGIYRVPFDALAQGEWTSMTLHTWAVGARDFRLSCNNGADSLYVTLTIENPDYPLEVKIAGDGEGDVVSEPEGIACGHVCRSPFEVGAKVALLAQSSAPDSLLVGWSGACEGASPLCEVTMSTAQTATATFVRLRQNNQAISAGGNHTCGLTDTGSVWCWGDNTSLLANSASQ